MSSGKYNFTIINLKWLYAEHYFSMQSNGNKKIDSNKLSKSSSHPTISNLLTHKSTGWQVNYCPLDTCCHIPKCINIQMIHKRRLCSTNQFLRVRSSKIVAKLKVVRNAASSIASRNYSDNRCLGFYGKKTMKASKKNCLVLFHVKNFTFALLFQSIFCSNDLQYYL